MVVIRERRNSDQYDLTALFHKYNALCFGGSLVLDFPLEWSSASLKKALGYVKWRKGTTKVMTLVMNNRFDLPKKDFESVFVHELVHVKYCQLGIDAGHGPRFSAECRRIRAMGVDVSEGDDIEVASVSSDIKLGPRLIFMVDLGASKAPAFVVLQNVPTQDDAIRLLGSLVYQYGSQAPTLYVLANSSAFAHSVPKSRDAKTVKSFFRDEKARAFLNPGDSTIFAKVEVDSKKRSTIIKKLDVNEVRSFFGK